MVFSLSSGNVVAFEIEKIYARDLLSTRQIDPLDYGQEIGRLEGKLARINNETEDVEGLLNEGIDELLKLNNCFKTGGWEESRSLIGSMYPENLTFDGFSFRTARVNDVVEIIYHINSALPPNKNGTKKNFSSLSREVTRLGLEPRTPTLKVLCSTN